MVTLIVAVLSVWCILSVIGGRMAERVGRLFKLCIAGGHPTGPGPKPGFWKTPVGQVAGILIIDPLFAVMMLAMWNERHRFIYRFGGMVLVELWKKEAVEGHWWCLNCAASMLERWYTIATGEKPPVFVDDDE